MFVLFVVVIYCLHKVESAGVPIQLCKIPDGYSGYQASPTARVCDNEANHCDLIFPLAGIANISTHVPDKCYDSSTAKIVKTCAWNCALCCTIPRYACGDKEPYCAQFKAQGYCSRMSALTDCASTCGLCDKPGAGGYPCPDLISKCRELVIKGANCSSEFMEEQCGKTCYSKRCQSKFLTATATSTVNITATTCENLRKDCELYPHYCNQSHQTTAFMEIYCRKTCDLCK